MKDKKNLIDERTIQIDNKIHSEGYIIINIALLTCIFLKALIFNMPYSSYRLELIIFIILNIYITSKKIYYGNDTLKYIKPFKYSLFQSICLSFVITVINFIKYKSNIKITFICFLIILSVSFILYFFVLLFVQKIATYRKNTLDKKYED